MLSSPIPTTEPNMSEPISFRALRCPLVSAGKEGYPDKREGTVKRALVSLILAATPLAIRVDVAPLGRGSAGTVVGVAIQVAPEDRPRVGERLRVMLSLLKDGAVADEGSAVVNLQPDGTALLYREWPVGSAELRVVVADEGGTLGGAWAGPVVVAEMKEPFAPAEGAPPDAVALSATPPAEAAVRFEPPVRQGGVGAVQLQVQVGEGVAVVEFFQDDTPLVRRNRPPWTVSVTLGEVPRRTTIRAVARAADGAVLGEDALVLNAPPGQVPLEILLAERATEGAERVVTVAVPSVAEVDEVTLSLDDEVVARWTACPCVVRIAEHDLAKARLLTAEGRFRGTLRGQTVRLLSGGFLEAVRVEQVELPVVVLDAAGRPVTGLGRDDFEVAEDGTPVTLDGFGAEADLPLAVGIVVDVSGSMKDPFPAVRKAVTGFAEGLLRPGDRFFLVTFAFEPTLRLGWTRDPALLAPALERVEPEGGTSLHDAVVRALELFRSERGRKAVVLLSDGDDTTSRTAWQVALRYARTVRTPVFPIGFRISPLDVFTRQRLKELAGETGGEAFFAPASGELREVYRRIGEQLRGQYLLSYRSPSTDTSGRFRQVTVRVRRQGLSARTIAGYLPAQ